MTSHNNYHDSLASLRMVYSDFTPVSYSTKLPGHTTSKSPTPSNGLPESDSIEQIESINPKDSAPKFSKLSIPLSNIIKQSKEN